MQGVLQSCLSRGARTAEPGEFTLRAFLNGRMDLTRAEAVLGVVEARNPAQLEASLRQLAGGLSSPIERLRDRLLDVLAHLEAGLDFVDEEDVGPIARSQLADELADAALELRRLTAQFRDRDLPTSRPRVVLVGPPNAGKSRLFNALMGEGRAIVSHVAGTTRDYLSAPTIFDGIAVEVIDTAGIEDSAQPIESQAQALRMAQAVSADLLLVCEPTDEAAVLLDWPDRPHLRLSTKCDLAPARSGTIGTSATTHVGLNALQRAVADAIRSRLDDGDALAVTGARCRDSLDRAGGSLVRASEVLSLGGGDELVSIDLRQALEDLGQVVGVVVTDDILDRIFSRFCIGK